MRVLQVGSLSDQTGGPSRSLDLQIQGLLNSGVQVSCLMPPLRDGEKSVNESISCIYTPSIRSLLGMHYVPRYPKVNDLVSNYDLFHMQFIWSMFIHQYVSLARAHSIPYVISPRGSLYPQALRIRKWKKKIAWSLSQRRDLEQASCIHATCEEEMQYCRQLGLKVPIAVIPNPYDCTNVLNRPIQTNEIFRVGYLGRFHPRKRVEKLIYAFSELRSQLHDAELLLIGSGDKNYESFLRKETLRLNLNNVKYTGYLAGEGKDCAIRSLSVLVVPSDFENFGNVVPDALSRGVPVIASTGMPWQILKEQHCGWWIDNDQQSINRAILEALSLSKSQLTDMGKRGQKYVANYLSVEKLGMDLNRLYSWILRGGAKPDFVYL